MIAYQQHAFPYYFILGYNKNHGMIPGFYNGSKAVYAYGGKEFTAKEFYWIVVDNPGYIILFTKEGIGNYFLIQWMKFILSFYHFQGGL